MATKINVRSPYFVRISDASLKSVVFNLYVWDGVETSIPSEVTIPLIRDVIGSNTHITFELADYIRDYIVTEYGDYSTNAVWAYWSYQMYSDLARTTAIGTPITGQRLAVDGYGFFEDGVHPRESVVDTLLQDNTDIYYLDGRDIVFAVYDEGVTNVSIDGASVPAVYWEQVNEFWDEYVATWDSGGIDQIIGDSTDSSNKIVYVKITETELFDDIETITITNADLSTTTLTLHKVCEPKYTPLNVIFYNKYGAMQNLWFFKRSDTTLSVTGDTFKRNIVDFSSTPTYNTSSHQIKSFNVNGIESVRLNTDYLPEGFNEIIKQIMLSEEVWIDNGTQVLPVRPTTNSLTYKTSANNKLISYSLDFEYAYDKINNIR